MEFLNVLQFIKQYEQDEDARHVDELNELNEDTKNNIYNCSYNYIDIMEI